MNYIDQKWEPLTSVFCSALVIASCNPWFAGVAVANLAESPKLKHLFLYDAPRHSAWILKFVRNFNELQFNNTCTGPLWLRRYPETPSYSA